jgi:FtsZ-interacting cell division protein YlmF
MAKSNKDLLNQLKSSLSKAGPESKTETPSPVLPVTPPATVKPVVAAPKAVNPTNTAKTQNKPKKAPEPENRNEAPSKLKSIKTQAKKDKSTVVSITLYPKDLDHIDQIIDYLRDNQRRITRSEAIKLALRGVSLNRQMLDIYPKIQEEDGRRNQNIIII